jgi:amidophosphoribosyltransferase
MCGILGVVATTPVNQLLYDGLMVLQHRGQDAAGIVTVEDDAFHMHKGSGLVRDVFRTRNMRALPGNMGIAHCRYPTAGSAFDSALSQPFYVNSPFGIVLGHNGNLTNAEQLKEEMFRQDLRHINTNSDSEVLLNTLAHELQATARGCRLDLDTIFAAVAAVHRRCRGAYAVVAMIAGHGLLAFRDPFGIRPLVFGTNETAQGTEYLFASESVALDTLGFQVLRDVDPGEAIFIDLEHRMHQRQCASNAVLSPCIFEFVYLARPDSVIDGVSVYEARLSMGERLADKLVKHIAVEQIDVVIPIPDSSRPSAMQLAQRIGVPYREGFVKNRYIGRTFIEPTQDLRERGVALKFNALTENLAGKRVVMIDDSLVRGTTAGPLVKLLRDAGATEVHLRITCPPITHACHFGVDMGHDGDLMAARLTVEEMRELIGADSLAFLSLDGMMRAIEPENGSSETGYCNACYTGRYPMPVDEAQPKLSFEGVLS